MGTTTLEAAARRMLEFEERDMPRHVRTGWAGATLLAKGHYLQRALICARAFGDKSGADVLAEVKMGEDENFITSSPP